MVKKIFMWLVVAFIIFFIGFQPKEAAEVAKTVGGFLLSVLQGFGDFFSRLF